MKNFNLFFLIIMLGFNSCSSKNETVADAVEIVPKTPVEVVSVGNGSIDDEQFFFGTTIYLKRNVLTSPIPAFVTTVNIKLGDKVNKGDILYVLQSKENKALGNDVAKIDTSLTNFGVIKIKASASGIISTLDRQQVGEYVLEGTQLCTIAESNDLIFQVNVPYEFINLTKIGSSCIIILPDNSVHNATFVRALTTMNVSAQTQTILAKSNETLFLPENMIAKVGIRKNAHSNKQLLPKSAVLSDEMMKDFWVMKLINDSTAVKIPVVTGNKNAQKIEILTPQFTINDRIISVGNYGLSDTSQVKISIIK